MKHVAIVTCRNIPEPDVDEPLYVPALARHGLRATLVAWEDPAIRWADFDLVLLRSTWNYYRDLPAFLLWLDATAASAHVENAAPLVRWNAHKGYLLELEQRGIDIVPTRLLRAGDTTSLSALRAALATDDLVLKPAVSAGSHRTLRATALNDVDARAHLADLTRDTDVLVQPYLRAVEGSGERAIVCIDGEVSHAVRKSPRFGDDNESVSAALPISDAERAFAHKVLSSVPGANGPLLYARVDALTDEDGTLRLMELELIEPSLFFLQAPEALERFASAITRRLG